MLASRLKCNVKKAQKHKSAPAKPTPKAKATTYIDEVNSGRDITKRDSNNQMLADAFDSKFEKLGINMPPSSSMCFLRNAR